jgi:hypothetical protein
MSAGQGGQVGRVTQVGAVGSVRLVGWDVRQQQAKAGGKALRQRRENW